MALLTYNQMMGTDVNKYHPPPPSNVEKKHYITIIHDFIYEIRICIYFSYSYLNKVKGFNECCGRHNAFFTFQRCPTLHLSEVFHITPVWGVPHYTCLRCPTLHLSEVSHITPVWGVPHYTCLRCPTLHLSEVSHMSLTSIHNSFFYYFLSK